MNLQAYLDRCTPEGRAELEEIVGVFPAMRAAIEQDGDWEDVPESMEGGVWHAEHDGERRGWRKVGYALGYEVTRGIPFLVVHLYDGDWQHTEAVEFADRSFRRMKAYGYEASVAGWTEYARFVLERGTDPLGEYLVDRELSEVADVEVVVAQMTTGCELVAWRERGQAVLRPLRELHEGVFRFFGCSRDLPLVESRDPFKDGATREPEEDVRTLDRLTATMPERWQRPTGSIAIFAGRISVTSPRPVEQVAADLRNAARRDLEGKP